MDGGKEHRITLTSNDDSLSAFTTAELGDMLPRKAFRSGQHENCWEIHYGEFPMQTARTEADARAKLLAHLIEKGAVTC